MKGNDAASSKIITGKIILMINSCWTEVIVTSVTKALHPRKWCVCTQYGSSRCAETPTVEWQWLRCVYTLNTHVWWQCTSMKIHCCQAVLSLFVLSVCCGLIGCCHPHVTCFVDIFTIHCVVLIHCYVMFSFKMIFPFVLAIQHLQKIEYSRDDDIWEFDSRSSLSHRQAVVWIVWTVRWLWPSGSLHWRSNIVTSPWHSVIFSWAVCWCYIYFHTRLLSPFCQVEKGR